MSLLIKALDKAQSEKIEAQAQSAKIEAQAQSVKIEAQAQNIKMVAQAENGKKALTLDQSAQAELTQSEKSKKSHADADKSKAAAAIKSQITQAQTPLKTANIDLELSLSSTNSTFSESKPKSAQVAVPASKTPSNQYTAVNSTAKGAANVFSAKGVDAKTDSARIMIIAAAGLIALLAMGLYFYQFVDNSPPVKLPQRPSIDEFAAAQQATPVSIPETEPIEIAEPTKLQVFEPAEPILIAEKRNNARQQNRNTKAIEAASMEDEDGFSAEENASEKLAEQDTQDLIEIMAATTPKQKSRKAKNNAAIASDSASIQVTRSATQPSINPVLMSAYEAYNAGNDIDAIKLYKQVLQRDIRNVDALLGLGAIASRQGRSADANGWYAKVLEVDPRNSIAKTAMLENDLQSNQPQDNVQANETSLKNMLAKQPDDANIHVALGNLYAQQNQWPAAQQAYFDAYSINKTADNAYNLAVSLDQMGKPKLALPYYLRALELATNASNIDQAALQARISAIQ